MDHSRELDNSGLDHRGDEIHLLRDIIRTNQVLMHGFSRATGLPASRFVLLRQLAAGGGKAGVMDLARQLGINPAAVTRQVKEMEGEGVVCREADPRDGRRSHVVLTPEGYALFEAIHERTHQLERELIARIGPDAMAVAGDVLAKLREFVESVLREGIRP